MKTDDRPRLYVDFDGVIHDGKENPKRPTPILGKPVPGAFRFLSEANQIFCVRILSWRFMHGKPWAGNRTSVRRWFKRHGWPTHVGGALEHLWLGPEENVIPVMTISTRVSCFRGTFPDPEQLTKFEPYSQQQVHTLNS